MKHLDITVLVDKECITDDDPVFLKRGKSSEYHVINSLRCLKHAVSVLPVGGEVESLLAGITEKNPDVIFNMSEQFNYERRLDANVAGLLEMLKIPFTGTGLTGLALCRHKGISKTLLNAAGIDVPWHTVVCNGEKANLYGAPSFPLIVKPVQEDGSDGISKGSIVGNAKDTNARCAMMHRQFRQPAIVEEFVAGRELYVSILGNEHPEVLWPRELYFPKAGHNRYPIATGKIKWDVPYRKRLGIRYGFAKIDKETMRRIEETCIAAYRILNVSGYGRVDLRMTDSGRISVIEVNPNPSLIPGEELALSALKGGIGYMSLIQMIVEMAVSKGAR